MRFIHTADWHLGRLFYNSHLTTDQAHVLDQLVDLAREAAVDAVIVSGDVFDRPLPPAEAVELLDEVLARLVVDTGATVVLIAGNHDSPERLGFGSRLLARSRLHIFSHPVVTTPVLLEDGVGRVVIHAVPYAEPAVVRTGLGDETVHDHHAALEALLARVSAAGQRPSVPATAGEPRVPKPRAKARRILLAHAFVAGGAESESERPLSVGGSGAVGSDLFAGFDYTALGHLHRPQTVSTGGRLPEVIPDQVARYAGSLLKYSFSEADHRKTVTIVDLTPEGGMRLEEIALSPKRDLVRIEGLFSDILGGHIEGLPPEGCQDYMLVALRDRGPVFDALARLRARYPNVMTIERPGHDPVSRTAGTRRDHRRLSERDLFAAFYRDVTGDPLDPDHETMLAEVLETVLTARRSPRTPQPRTPGSMT